VEQRFDNVLYPPCFGGDRAAGAPAAEPNVQAQLLEQELARQAAPAPPLPARRAWGPRREESHGAACSRAATAAG
jgi:hypothetical protein